MSSQQPKPKKPKINIVAIPDPGTFGKILQDVRLALYLMGEKRVPMRLKLLPIAAALYWLLPLEALISPILATPIDDLAILWATIQYLIELSPPDVVQHYRDVMAGKVTRVKGKPISTDVDPDDVVDGEFREEDDAETEKHDDDEKGDGKDNFDWTQFA